MDLVSALIGGLVGGTIAAVIGGIVTLQAQRRQHAHEQAMARQARFADRVRELASRLAPELRLLLRSPKALDALRDFVAAVARVESFLIWTSQTGVYTVTAAPTDDDVRNADRAVEHYRETSECRGRDSQARTATMLGATAIVPGHVNRA